MYYIHICYIVNKSLEYSHILYNWLIYECIYNNCNFVYVSFPIVKINVLFDDLLIVLFDTFNWKSVILVLFYSGKACRIDRFYNLNITL